jgi:transketolase
LELFDTQSRSLSRLGFSAISARRLAVEAGATQGWCKYVGGDGDVIGVDRFGASVPGEVVMRESGFSVENVCGRAIDLVNRKREAK